MSFFNRKREVIYNGYEMLKNILKQEQDEGRYLGRAAAISAEERYLPEDLDLEDDMEEDEDA